MNLKNLKTKVRKLRAGIKPKIPKVRLVVVPRPGETDEEAMARAIAAHPNGPELALLREQGIRFPTIWLRLALPQGADEEEEWKKLTENSRNSWLI